MKRTSKITIAVLGLIGAGAATFVAVRGLPASTPVLSDLPVGEAAPAFALTDARGEQINLADYAGKTVVLEWNNPDCPTVKQAYADHVMQDMQAAAARDGVVWLTVNSGGPWRQGHMNGSQAQEYVMAQGARPAAYLLDPKGTVGRKYGAKTTPHIFIVDGEGSLVYRGSIDGPSPQLGQGDRSRNHVLAALEELKAGKPVSVTTSRAYGCAVKYG